MKVTPGTVAIYVGNFGDYVIPERFNRLRTTKNGLPDKRNKRGYAEFMAWVAERESLEKSRKERT